MTEEVQLAEEIDERAQRYSGTKPRTRPTLGIS